MKATKAEKYSSKIQTKIPSTKISMDFGVLPIRCPNIRFGSDGAKLDTYYNLSMYTLFKIEH